MQTHQLLAFLIPTLALNITPGPDLFFVIGQSLRGGPRATVRAAGGLWIGYLFHVALVSAGVATLLMNVPAALTVLKVAGGGYLLFLGIRQLRAKHSGPVEVKGGDPLRAGIFVSALNPKTAVFFLAFLPQFLEPGHGSASLQLATLGLLFSATSTAVNLAFGFSASRFGGSRSQAGGPVLERACGAAMVAMAARLAFAS